MIFNRLNWLFTNYDDDYALEQKVFNIHCLLGVIIFLINIGVDAVTQVYWVVRVITAIYTVVYAAFYFLSRFKNKYEYLTVPLLFVSLSSLNYSWFFLDGVQGGITVAFILVAVVHAVTFPLRFGLLVPAIVGINYVILVYIHFNYPHLIDDHYPSETAKLIDGISLAIISIIISGLVIYLFRKSYDNEREKLKLKNEELLNAQEELKRYTENLYTINQQMEIAKNEAERLHQQKSDFLTTISHEIRTPLNSVIGMSRLIKLEQVSPEEQRNFKVLKDSANNLLSLINDVLDFSKIEAGKISLEEVNTSLKTLLVNTVSQFSHIEKEKAVKLNLHYDKRLPAYIYVDATRLKQVLYNLISNAMKFTEKGNVDVTVSYLEQKSTSEQVTIHFEVKDTGIGINESRQKFIFRAFEQESIAINRKYGGTGLGLSITKELINLMGSEIHLESIEDKGAKFFFELSLKIGEAKEEDEDHAQEASTEEIDLSFLKILVIDDNDMNLQLAEAMFKKWNVIIDTADNGQDGLRLHGEKSYDFILLDLQMPVMDGYQVAQEIIKAETDFADKTPIIALTASVQKEVKEKVKSIGMIDFLSKPFTHEDLLEVIFKYTKVK